MRGWFNKGCYFAAPKNSTLAGKFLQYHFILLYNKQICLTILFGNLLEQVKTSSMLDTSSRKQNPTPSSDWELCEEEIDDMAANPKMWLASKHINAVSAIARHQFPTIGAFYNVQWAYGDGYPQTSQPNWSQYCLKDESHWVLLTYGLNKQNFAQSPSPSQHFKFSRHLVNL